MSGPTCQMYGSGVTVPCGECNMVLLDGEEIAGLRARVAELEAAREREHERFLMWRAVEDAPCKDCTGSGVKLYGSTSTWRGGAGGQTVTTAVCNKCWGSGSAEQPWPSWRNKP